MEIKGVVTLILICVDIASNVLPGNGDTIGGECVDVPLKADASARTSNNVVAGIFDAMTVEEIQRVFDFLQTRRDLNVVAGRPSSTPAAGGAAPHSNGSYVYSIELMPPNKAQALKYLDENGSKVDRAAKVVLLRRDKGVIEEYKVGPLIHPTFYMLLKDPSWRQNIPYDVRPLLTEPDWSSWKSFICNELTKISSILKDISDGYSYSPDCSQRCLTYRIETPGYLTRKLRSCWVVLERRVEGSSLHPIGLEFRVVESAGSRHAIGHVWFKGQWFDDMDDFVSQYKNKTVHMERGRDPASDDSDLFNSALNEPTTAGGGEMDKRANTGGTRRRTPKCYMPDGRRFTITRHQVTWLAWSFVFNIRTSTGPIFNDVRFNGKRIIYEHSLQELATIQHGDSPATYATNYLESAYQIGSRAYELYSGLDCPQQGSVFLDFVHYVNGRPTVYPRSACVFEEIRGPPLRRRRFRFQEGGGRSSADQTGRRRRVDGLADSSLVVRTMIIGAMKEYVLDFVFHQNAVMETIISVSGYLSSHYKIPGSFGHEIYNDAVGIAHHHAANFKVDLDIDGTVNRVETIIMKKKDDYDDETCDEPPPSKQSKVTSGACQHRFERGWRSAESDPTYLCHPHNCMLLIASKNTTNRFGNPRSYWIQHVTTFTNLILRKNSSHLSWLQNEIAITKRKDEQETSSTVYHSVNKLEPLFDFRSAFVDDRESIHNEDVVAWVTLLTAAVPHSENVPVVQTIGTQMTFALRPFNYFDTDPSLTSSDTVSIVEENGRLRHRYRGDWSSVEKACRHVMINKSTAVNDSKPVKSALIFCSAISLIISHRIEIFS